MTPSEMTNIASKRSLRILLIALLGAMASACASTSTGSGSESHFAHCKTNADCDSGRCETGTCAGATANSDSGKDASHDASFTEPDSQPVNEPPPEQPANCVLSNTSTIPHVHVEFPSQPCAFTQAEASAGIRFSYDVVIDEDVPGYMSRVSSSGVVFVPGATVVGLQVATVIQGGTQRYCLCDEGDPPAFCPLGDGGFSYLTGNDTCKPITLTKGVYAQSWPSIPIGWDGRNWDGPSDTTNPEGAPFPPGDYTLEISIAGQIVGDAGTRDVDLDARFLVRLVP